MTATPMQVQTRPFAIEPVTNIMLPDGIFDNALHELRIACPYSNDSGGDLANVDLYLESVGDPGIVVQAHTHHFDVVPAGAAVLVMWDANFQAASPGKPLISFVATADGFEPGRTIQQIFVSQTRYDEPTNSYTCTIEEGTLTLSKISAIVPAVARGQMRDRECVCGPDLGPNIPTGMTMAWTPHPPYAGVHGDLPFADPWWKIVALIVAGVAAIVAAVAAALGAGKAEIKKSGTFEETGPSVNCCGSDPNPGAKSGTPPKAEYTVAGVASSIASGALVVACTDVADPFWRGQEGTPPAATETTIGERVVAKWALPQPPNAGKPYSCHVEWTYTRFTTGATYEHSVSETVTNVHLSDSVEVTTPATVHPYEPLWVQAKFAQHEGGQLFKGSDLYSFVLFRSPGGVFFVQPLTDDGLGYTAANDGVYAGSLDLERAARVLWEHGEKDAFGKWRVYVFAQDVNRTQPGTPPEIAAQEVGGFFIASAVSITFDPTLPCPLEAKATIDVS
jgi:hypothetical protein